MGMCVFLLHFALYAQVAHFGQCPMQLTTSPHPARGPQPPQLPRRILADLETYAAACTVSLVPETEAEEAWLEDVCVGLAFRFLRVGADAGLGFSLWRPVYGTEADTSCAVQCPVQLSSVIPPTLKHDDASVVALSTGDVLVEGASVREIVFPSRLPVVGPISTSPVFLWCNRHLIMKSRIWCCSNSHLKTYWGHVLRVMALARWLFRVYEGSQLCGCVLLA